MRRRRQRELSADAEGAVLPCEGMDTLLHDAVRERVTALADDYAAAFVASLPQARSEDELRQATSGLLLTYLAEVAGIM